LSATVRLAYRARVGHVSRLGGNLFRNLLIFMALPRGTRTPVFAVKGRSPTSRHLRRRPDHGLQPKLSTLIAGPLLNTMASWHPVVRLRLALQNEARTPCYHFATQLGSTGWYGLERGRALRRNSLDNSVFAGTEQNSKRRQQPNYECVALPAELPRLYRRY
jgi:hypothetical protein